MVPRWIYLRWNHTPHTVPVGTIAGLVEPPPQGLAEMKPTKSAPVKLRVGSAWMCCVSGRVLWANVHLRQNPEGPFRSEHNRQLRWIAAHQAGCSSGYGWRARDGHRKRQARQGTCYGVSVMSLSAQHYCFCSFVGVDDLKRILMTKLQETYKKNSGGTFG